MNQQVYAIQEISEGFESCSFDKVVNVLLESHEAEFVEKGAYLFHQGMRNDKIYFVLDGQIKVGVYDHEDEQRIKAVLGKGEIIGGLSLKKNATQENFAKASIKSCVLGLTVIEYKDLLKEKPNFSMFHINMLNSKYQQLEKRLNAVVFKKSRTRIIEFLINLVKTNGQRVGYEILVRGFFKHREIADMTATGRQTVTTVLNDLKKKNILISNHKRLLIRDMNLLIKETNQHS